MLHIAGRRAGTFATNGILKADATMQCEPRDLKHHMISEQIETVIIGGGQAGLAMSYYLGQLGREHVILEQQRVAERWRSERWDSLAFQSPNWNIHLPGFAFQAADPDAFASRDEIVQFIDSYAAYIHAPLRLGLAATGLRQKPDSKRLIVETQANFFEAKNVVIATGPFQAPVASLQIGGTALHLHSSQYRNPELLPQGAVLVIGSGNSGYQIAEELCLAGRRVYLSVSKHRRVPRRYRGKDYVWWYVALGDGETTVDERKSSRVSPLFTGVRGGHDANLRRLAADGVVLLGSVLGGQTGTLTIAPDLGENLAQGDASLNDFTQRVDAHVARNGLEFPPSERAEVPHNPKEVTDPVLALDLAAAGVSSIIWANGFRYAFDWVDLPVFANGTPSSERVPEHKRGLTTVPGVYFLGLPWLHKLKSAFLNGVGEDAEHLAEQIRTDARL
jgi:putative flavoprotein involved in K+ transport